MENEMNTDMGKGGYISKDVLMECITSAINPLKESIRELKNDVFEINKKFDSLNERTIESEKNYSALTLQSNKRFESLEETSIKLENKYTALENKVINDMLYIKQHVERNKLVFKGIQCAASDNYAQKVKTFCEERFDLRNPNIINMSMLGANGDKLLVAEFLNEEDKKFLLKNKDKLNGSKFSIKQYIIPSLYSQHNKLLALRKEIKSVNKNAKVNVKLNSIDINGVKFMWSNIHGLIMNGSNGISNLNEMFKHDFTDFIEKLLRENKSLNRNNSYKGENQIMVSPSHLMSSSPQDISKEGEEEGEPVEIKGAEVYRENR